MSPEPVGHGTRRVVPGAHGLALRLREWAGSGRPLLFLHGFLLDSHSWDFVIPRFVDRRHVLALDCRGHGGSDHDPGYRYHHVAFGMDAREVLRYLDLNAVDVVAHSTSGHAAIGLAARDPERIHRLVLVDAGPELPSGGRGGVRHGADAALDPTYATPEDYAQVLTRRHPRARSDVIAHIARCGLRPTSEQRPGNEPQAFEPTHDLLFTRPKTQADPEARRSFDRSAWAADGEKQLWAELADVACPLLVVRGAASTSFSRDTALRMVAASPALRRAEEIDDAGHNAMLDQPERLADAIERFLSES